MSDFYYVIFQADKVNAAEKRGFANLLRNIAGMRGLTTLWNCSTDTEDNISGLSDADLTPDKYPLLYRMPGETGCMCKDSGAYTTKCFYFREMTDGRFCAVITKSKTVRIADGVDEETGELTYSYYTVDCAFSLVNTGYDEIVDEDPGIIQSDLSDYEV